MSGRIRDEDISQVREKSPIADVVGDRLALRPAGGGSLKGLCPFHEEKSPSFNVSPERGYYYCFGCGAGGDVITFVQKVEHLTFAEAVEKLAARSGIQLRYEGGSAAPRQEHSRRARLVAAHTAAAEFFAGALRGRDEAEPARHFLAERGFDLAAAEQFEVGYAPGGWDALTAHLRGQGYTVEEMVTAGLARQGHRGPYDVFRGRLVWPIRDLSGDVVGFGARRLRADDPIAAKYINTAETPIFKKSTLLYGIDRAKRQIAASMRAVVVEGYTDVMACHLAGETTAVATCGTAFGAEHIATLRRMLMDQDEFRGEVIFTFDGDEAGQRAALRAFETDQRFVAQTFVAVEPSGLDPCELRLAAGDEAVRDLVARREPLFQFVIRATLRRYDLETAEGGIAALAASAPLVARIRDRGLRPEYARRLAGWLGMEVEPVMARVAEAAAAAGMPAGPRGAGNRTAGRPGRAGEGAGGTRPGVPAAEVRAGSGTGAEGGTGSEPAPSRTGTARPGPARPDPDDQRHLAEREAVKVAVQRPALAGPEFDAIDPVVFVQPAYAAVHATVQAAGGAASTAGGAAWVGRLLEAAPEEATRRLVTELAVEPLRVGDDGVERYVGAILARVQELAVTRRVVQVKSKVQRLHPVDAAEEYNRLFGELLALEQSRRLLRERAMGAL